MKKFFIGLLLTIAISLAFADTDVSVIGAVLDLCIGLTQMFCMATVGTLLVSMER